MTALLETTVSATAPSSSTVTATLADLRPGQTAVISGFADEHSPLARRLHNLGFYMGCPVAVLRRAPLADPTIYLVCDYEICLRKHDAANILVENIH